MSADPTFAPPDQFDARVVVYTTPYCGYCWAAIRLLERRKIAFTRVDVRGDTDARRWLAQHTGQRTVPQIFIDGRSIGGYDELAELDEAGDLDALTS